MVNRRSSNQIIQVLEARINSLENAVRELAQDAGDKVSQLTNNNNRMADLTITTSIRSDACRRALEKLGISPADFNNFVNEELAERRRLEAAAQAQAIKDQRVRQAEAAAKQLQGPQPDRSKRPEPTTQQPVVFGGDVEDKNTGDDQKEADTTKPTSDDHK